MNPIAERKWSTMLFNPFVYVAGGRAVAYGIAVIVVAAAIAWPAGATFDGVLDLHVFYWGNMAWVNLLLSLIDWVCLSLVLAICGKIISKSRFRLIDVFGTQALARWPTIGMAALMLPPAFHRYVRELVHSHFTPGALPPFTPDAIYFYLAIFFSLPLLVWMVVLMYNAFGIACNVRGAKAIVTFIIGLIGAEILSKFVIYVGWIVPANFF